MPTACQMPMAYNIISILWGFYLIRASQNVRILTVSKNVTIAPDQPKYYIFCDTSNTSLQNTFMKFFVEYFGNTLLSG